LAQHNSLQQKAGGGAKKQTNYMDEPRRETVKSVFQGQKKIGKKKKKRKRRKLTEIPAGKIQGRRGGDPPFAGHERNVSEITKFKKIKNTKGNKRDSSKRTTLRAGKPTVRRSGCRARLIGPLSPAGKTKGRANEKNGKK